MKTPIRFSAHRPAWSVRLVGAFLAVAAAGPATAFTPPPAPGADPVTPPPVSEPPPAPEAEPPAESGDADEPAMPESDETEEEVDEPAPDTDEVSDEEGEGNDTDPDPEPELDPEDEPAGEEAPEVEEAPAAEEDTDVGTPDVEEAPDVDTEQVPEAPDDDAQLDDTSTDDEPVRDDEPVDETITDDESESGTLARPTALRAVLTDERAIVIEWEAVAGATGYEVRRDGALISMGERPLHIDSDVTAGQRYEYAVAAFEPTRGRSAEAVLGISASAADRSDTTEPLAPGDVVARRLADGTVALAWRPGGDDNAIEGYNVYRNGVYHDTVHTLGYRDVDAPAGEVVFYEIAAFDAEINYSSLSPATLVEPLRETDRSIDELEVDGAVEPADGRVRIFLDTPGLALVLAGDEAFGVFADRVTSPAATLALGPDESLDIILPAGIFAGFDSDHRVTLGRDALDALGATIRIAVGAASDDSGIMVTFLPD